MGLFDIFKTSKKRKKDGNNLRIKKMTLSLPLK